MGFKNMRKQKLTKLFSGVPGNRLATPRLLNWLDANGFYTQVASTGHHGDYPGGLFDHSWDVTHKLLEMTHKLNLVWEKPDSPYIVGMFHDVCKIDEYEIEMVNGQSTVIKTEKCGDEHGAKSVRYLSELIPLTNEEILCIRYHMGPYIRPDWVGYDNAIKQYENVLWTHTADMYASRLMR